MEKNKVDDQRALSVMAGKKWSNFDFYEIVLS